MGELAPPIEPMLARLTRALPVGEQWRYEPKWDGFRCLVFRSGAEVDLRSRNQRELGRYFPEIVAAVRMLKPEQFVLDGELVISGDGRSDFAALMSRLHPAASRVETLSRATPAQLIAFDMLSIDDTALIDEPFSIRRRALEETTRGAPPAIVRSPSTDDREVARRWLTQLGHGIDGVVAKDARSRYEPGRRTMVKVKPERTADCVVAGCRLFAHDSAIASLLLGLFERDDRGRDVLRHVGVVASLGKSRQGEVAREIASRVVPLAGHPWEHGFALEGGPMGRLKGAAGRWTPDLELDWIPLAPDLVCEVAFDQVDGHRFRHPARWRRWRPDRTPHSCRIEQLDPPSIGASEVVVR